MRETLEVPKTARKAMGRSRRLRIWEQHGGTCCLCGAKIDGVREKWTIEHLRALGLGGEDVDANCAPAHEDCRRAKDKDDVERIAKAKRVKQKHIGIRTGTVKKLSGPGFPKTEKALRRQPKTPLPPRQLFKLADEVKP